MRKHCQLGTQAVVIPLMSSDVEHSLLPGQARVFEAAQHSCLSIGGSSGMYLVGYTPKGFHMFASKSKRVLVSESCPWRAP